MKSLFKRLTTFFNFWKKKKSFPVYIHPFITDAPMIQCMECGKHYNDSSEKRKCPHEKFTVLDLMEKDIYALWIDCKECGNRYNKYKFVNACPVCTESKRFGNPSEGKLDYYDDYISSTSKKSNFNSINKEQQMGIQCNIILTYTTDGDDTEIVEVKKHLNTSGESTINAIGNRAWGPADGEMSTHVICMKNWYEEECEDFIKFLKTIKWKYPDTVQVYYSPASSSSFEPFICVNLFETVRP
jgi:hypothetical protein